MPRYQHFALLAHAKKRSLRLEKDKGIAFQRWFKMLPCEGAKSKGLWKSPGQTSLPVPPELTPAQP